MKSLSCGGDKGTLCRLVKPIVQENQRKVIKKGIISA
jgi:hypothetical protein